MSDSGADIERHGDEADGRDDDRTVTLGQLREVMSSPGFQRDWTVDRVLEIVAIVMVPLGVVLIGLGWWGAANTPLLPEQVPYVVSGGILGLGLLIGGGMLYLGSWLARLAAQDREQADRLASLLEELQRDLARQRRTAGGGAAPDPPGPATTPNGRYVATPNGTMFHRADCRIVAGRDDVREVSGGDEELQPCGMCAPLAEDARTA